MAFKKIQDLDAEITVALGGKNKQTGKANPTQVEGYYLGSKQTTNTRNKTKKSFLHILQTEKGNLGVWGKTDLDRKMTVVPVGVMVRITQSGTIATPNGDMYRFTVEIDEENAIEVDLPAGSHQEAQADETTDGEEDVPYFDDEPSSDEVDEETPADEVSARRPTPPARRAATPTAASQAKTKALLSSRATR